MYIVTVSKNHLPHIAAEFDNLETQFVGYPTFKRAYNGLLEINCNQIAGFIYCDPIITNKRSLAGLLKRADRLATKGTVFMVAVNDIAGLDLVLNEVNLDNLDLRLFHYEVLTDYNIRREIIAPILLSKKTPYKIKKEEVMDSRLRYLEPLRLPELFPTSVMEAIADPVSTSLDLALEADPVLASLDEKSVWYAFRCWWIYKEFGKTLEFDLKKWATSLTDEEYAAVKCYVEV